jgi:hypothetical protein
MPKTKATEPPINNKLRLAKKLCHVSRKYTYLKKMTCFNALKNIGPIIKHDPNVPIINA